MKYNIDDIKTVLWNTFKETVTKIELVDENNGNYIFNVYPEETSTLNQIANISTELYDTELFDIITQRDHLIIEFINPFVLEYKQFKFINESINKWITFDDKQIESLNKRFNNLNVKYHQNSFFKSIIKQLNDNKKLSKNQFNELKYLIEYGKTRYEDNLFTTKN